MASNDAGFYSKTYFAFGLNEDDAETIVYVLRGTYPHEYYGHAFGDVWMGCQINCGEGISFREFIGRAYKEGVMFATANLTIDQLNGMIANSRIMEHISNPGDDPWSDDDVLDHPSLTVERIDNKE